MAQFHPFNDLPKELRDSIWDMAIRKDDPAVQFFTIYDTMKDPDSVIDPTKKVHVTRGSELLTWFYTGLAAPRDCGKGRPSWTDGNFSTYLEDSGLWTACHESRERMLRHFKPSETSPQASRQRQLDRCTIWNIQDKPTSSVNMEFIRDNGERQYLTIRPSTDLICLQVLENSNISFLSDDFDWRHIGEFPLFRWRSNGGYYSSYSDLKNVAVEYDPAWEESNGSDRFPTVRGVFTFICDIPGLDAFWFIDYRLTRKFKREEGDRGRKMFHAGRITFIEVMNIDNEWCCCPKEGCSDECLSNGLLSDPHGAHDLVEDCCSYHLQWLDTESDDGEPWYYGDYGVLACVDLELEGELPTRTEWFDMMGERLERLGF